jgi:glutaminyl-peptide cyclotransferase
MLSSKESIVSLIICILLAIIIKLNFFNTNVNNNKNTIIKEEITKLDNQPKPSLLNSKLENTINYKVINIFQRKNPTVYTQGLFYYNNTIYESGGLYSKSTLTRMEWPSQKIILKLNLEQKYFAEGIAASFSNNILYQLTYKEREILLYSFPDMEYKNKIKMPGEMKEGWGLCAGKEKDEFFATDGSDKIFVLKIDKNNNELNVVSHISVTQNKKSLYRLNELIYDGKYIYCNVYFSGSIYKINPNNGEVINVYNMKPLIDHDIKNGKLTQLRLSMGDVLNGIVYIPEKKSFILTGKLWDYYYEVVFD